MSAARRRAVAHLASARWWHDEEGAHAGVAQVLVAQVSVARLDLVLVMERLQRGLGDVHPPAGRARQLRAQTEEAYRKKDMEAGTAYGCDVTTPGHDMYTVDICY